MKVAHFYFKNFFISKNLEIYQILEKVISKTLNNFLLQFFYYLTYKPYC